MLSGSLIYWIYFPPTDLKKTKCYFTSDLFRPYASLQAGFWEKIYLNEYVKSDDFGFSRRKYANKKHNADKKHNLLFRIKVLKYFLSASKWKSEFDLICFCVSLWEFDKKAFLKVACWEFSRQIFPSCFCSKDSINSYSPQKLTFYHLFASSFDGINAKLSDRNLFYRSQLASIILKRIRATGKKNTLIPEFWLFSQIS